MPHYVENNTAYKYRVEFLIDGEYVSPSSATITITNNAGSVVGDYLNKALTIPSGKTFVDVTISQADNTKTLPYEIRYVNISFVFDGKTYTTQDFYILREGIQFPLSADEVLRAAGMTSADIPVGDVDILGAYGLVEDDVNDEVDIDLILSTGAVELQYLIQAVKYKAAGLLMVGAQNSIYQMEQADNTLYRRFMEIDFDAITRSLFDQYAAALYKLLGRPTPDGRVFAIAVTGTDPVTGE